MDLDIQHLFKIIVIGDSSVGKTNLLSRFVKNQFSSDSKPTIGVDFATKTVSIDRKNIKVQVIQPVKKDSRRSVQLTITAVTEP